MAKLPIYRQQQTRQAVGTSPIQVNTTETKAIGQFAHGVSDLARVRSQMQEREARDYIIQSQNETSVALTEAKINYAQTAKTGTEYTDSIKSFIEQRKQAAVESAPNTKASQAASQYYDSLMAGELSQALPIAAKMNAQNTAKVMTDSLEIGLNKTFQNPSEFDSSLNSAYAIIDSSDLAENMKDTAKLEYRESLMTQKLLGTINQDPKQAVKDIESGMYNTLAPDTLNQLSNSAKNQSIALDKQTEINRQKLIEEQKAIQDAENARAQSDLEIGVSRGEFGYVEIEKAYDNGVITPEKRTQLVKSVDAQIEKLQKKNAAIMDISASIEAGYPLDYRNKDHKDAVDAYYENLPPEVQSNPDAIANLVKSTKVIPTQVESFFNAGLKGNIEQTVQTANAVARVNEVAPDVISQLPEDTKTVGITVSRLVAAGMDPAKAVELTNNNVYNTSPEMKAVLKNQLTTEDMNSKKQSGFKKAVKKISPSFFKPDRSQSMDAMEAEFSLLANNYYLKTHDIETAMDLATTDISRVWGSTWIDGKERMMKYSPEKMYSNGEETPWIYNQLKSELESIGVTSKASLMPDHETARSNRPSYRIMVEQDGVMIPLMINGVFQRYTPDFSITEEKKKAESEKQSAMERARSAAQKTQHSFRYKTKYGVER